MENKLQVIVKESGLEQTKANYILEHFQEYFTIASDWEKRAKELFVTNDNQKDLMAMARVGRLALKNERLRLEKERVKLKEQSLREGKAIDGIANVLKALIVPLEEFLDDQEHFTEKRIVAQALAASIEQDKKDELERIAKEKAAAEEQEKIRLENDKIRLENDKIRLENERLRAEAIEKERIALEEEVKADLERKEQDQLLEAERAKAEAERAKAEAERAKAEEDKINAVRAKAEAIAVQEKLTQELAASKAVKTEIIVCPNCGHKITQEDIQNALF